jgi:hypothetical protein
MHMTGSAGAGFLAGMFDPDAVVERGIADADSRLGLDFGAPGTNSLVRQKFDFGHRPSPLNIRLYDGPQRHV